MTFGIDEEPAGARCDVLHCVPGARHPAHLFRIEVIGVLVGPGRRVSLEIHRLHDLAGLADDFRKDRLDPLVRHDREAGAAETGKAACVETLDIEDRVQDEPVRGKDRSEERSGGKGWVSKCRYRGWTYN